MIPSKAGSNRLSGSIEVVAFASPHLSTVVLREFYISLTLQ